MFNKSFISLYFTEKQVLIALLDSNKKKIKKYAAASLPAGLIKNYKVINTKLMADILKGIWSKLKIKQKTVAIVIPEYSTFIKIIKLSNINISEINEALNWQLGEVLPYPLEEAITDWKILKKEDKEYSILSVSIEKKTLDTYLQAFEMAELFPIIVEIPSVGIARIAPDENVLIVYVSDNETILVALSESKLVGSSLIDGSSPEDIAKTSMRMLNHYKDAKIEKVLMAGVKIDTTKFNEILKAPVNYLSKSWGNVPDADAQKFLVPITSQLQEPTIPTDPFSLNLIPTDLVGKYKAARIRLQVWSMSLAVTLFVWISFLSTIGSYFYVSMITADTAAKVAAASSVSGNRQELLTKIKEINNTSKKIIDIKRRSFSVAQIVNLISASVTDGIVIDSIKVDLERGEIDIVGVSNSRQSLVSFRDNLEKVEEFGSPEVPLSSYEKETNLDFEILISYLAAQPAKEVKNGK